MHPPPENDEEEINWSPLKVGKPKISLKMVKKPDGKWEIKKESENKAKKHFDKNWACEICVDKKFTTKRSLQRHNNSFHIKKHSIKGGQVTPKVKVPKITFVDGGKFERKSPPTENQEIYDHSKPFITGGKTPYLNDEPIDLKSAKFFGEQYQKAKSNKLKRKHQQDPNEFHLERDNQKFSRDEPVVKRPKGVNSRVPAIAGIKRKLKESGPSPDDFKRKKFHWESY